MLELGYPMTLGTLNWKVAMEYFTQCWYGHLVNFVIPQALDIRCNLYQLKLLQ